jgi:hypothetical protein
MHGSQNINLAVPIAYFTELSSERYLAFSDMIIDVPFFVGFFPAPDFGAHFGVRPWETRAQLGGTSFSYRVSDLPRDLDDIIEEYILILEQNMFESMGDMTVSGATFRRFYNSLHDVILSFIVETIRTVEVITVNVA